LTSPVALADHRLPSPGAVVDVPGAGSASTSPPRRS